MLVWEGPPHLWGWSVGVWPPPPRRSLGDNPALPDALPLLSSMHRSLLSSKSALRRQSDSGHLKLLAPTKYLIRAHVQSIPPSWSPAERRAKGGSFSLPVALRKPQHGPQRTETQFGTPPYRQFSRPSACYRDHLTEGGNWIRYVAQRRGQST